MNVNIRHLQHYIYRIKNSLFRNSSVKKKSDLYRVSLSENLIGQYNKTRFCKNTKLLCYAPFSNLYFKINGDVCACCYNRTHLLGKYPQLKIMDIWESDSIKTLRESIEHGDLTKGCYPCVHQWQEGAFSTVLAKNYDSYSVDKKFPTGIELELSNTCNLQCIMCSSRFSSSFENFDNKGNTIYNQEFVDDLKTIIPHLKKAKFLGGEPFFIPIYYDIWEEFIKLNPDCELIVTTNGTILNNRTRDIIKKGKFNLVVSIDSFHKETYEKIRIHANFDKTMENLHYLIDFCKKNNRYIGIVACFMKQNWEEIPEMIQLCNSMNIPLSFNRVWYPPECSIWNSDVVLMQAIIEKYTKASLPYSTFTEKQNKNAFNDLISLVESWKNNLIQNKGIVQSEISTDEMNIALKERLMDYAKTDNIEADNVNLVFDKVKMLLASYPERERKLILFEITKNPIDMVYREVMFNDIEGLKKIVSDIIGSSSNYV